MEGAASEAEETTFIIVEHYLMACCEYVGTRHADAKLVLSTGCFTMLGAPEFGFRYVTRTRRIWLCSE